jgi:hypothetical protein
MEPNLIHVIAIACAGLGVIATVVTLYFKWKELQILREIRDRQPPRT